LFDGLEEDASRMTGSINLITLAATWAATGLMLGAAYFAAVRRTVELFAASGSRWMPVALTFARLIGATLFLAVAGQFGATPLLGAFLGFLVARAVALRRAKRAA
jgi:hypothetical protein